MLCLVSFLPCAVPADGDTMDVPFRVARGAASLDICKQHSFIQLCLWSVSHMSYMSGVVFDAETTYKAYWETTPALKCIDSRTRSTE